METDQYKLEFGKYKGCHLGEIPLGYLKWGSINLTRQPAQTLFTVEVQRRQTQPKTVTNANKHLNHEMKVVDGPFFGKHAGKLMCVQCNKWVMWLPQGYKEKLK